jgi:hypothetical protein
MAEFEIFVVILGDLPTSRKIFSVRAPVCMSVAEWNERHTVPGRIDEETLEGESSSLSS